ncbi:MAG: class I SAM-dependent methyltransferase [Candidatus Sabulitectum sp.]|nr:class I SAM-dependent methyltransferase [Candidatus Sabulitectum sp.]
MKTFYAGHDKKYMEYRAQGKPGWDVSDNGYAVFQSDTKDVINRGNAPSSGFLLELGCGAGNMTVWFAERGYTAHGIDIAPTAIEWARERAAAGNTMVQFTVGDVVQLAAYSDSSFDFVFDGHCLHCIIGKDRAVLLKNVFRVLKPGGYVMFNTMCGPVIQERIENYDPVSRCTVYGDIASRYFGDPDDIIAEIKTAGFEIIQCKIEAGDSEKSNHYMVIEAGSRLSRGN